MVDAKNPSSKAWGASQRHGAASPSVWPAENFEKLLDRLTESATTWWNASQRRLTGAVRWATLAVVVALLAGPLLVIGSTFVFLVLAMLCAAAPVLVLDFGVRRSLRWVQGVWSRRAPVSRDSRISRDLRVAPVAKQEVHKQVDGMATQEEPLPKMVRPLDQPPIAAQAAEQAAGPAAEIPEPVWRLFGGAQEPTPTDETARVVDAIRHQVPRWDPDEGATQADEGAVAQKVHMLAQLERTVPSKAGFSNSPRGASLAVEE